MPYADPETARRESARRMREMRARRATKRSERVHTPETDASDAAVARAVYSWLAPTRDPSGILCGVDWLSHAVLDVLFGRPVKPCASSERD